tara:strand:- start:7843 stop:8454 length:612 start_codon:yes stop_codon:yes gene_type:complete
MKFPTYNIYELSQILLRDVRIERAKVVVHKKREKASNKAILWANTKDWSKCTEEEKWEILMNLAYKLGLPYGLTIEDIDGNGKHEAVWSYEEHLADYYESINEAVATLSYSESQPNQVLITASYVAIIAAIITAIHKRNLHRLSVPYPHFDIVPLNEPSFTVQNILAVFEGFSLSIFSRPPPSNVLHNRLYDFGKLYNYQYHI